MAVCDHGACSFECEAGYVRCGDGCCTPQVSAGFAHTCFADAEGGAWCWGDGSFGQLGYGLFVPSAAPVAVSLPGIPVSAIAAGGHHTCAISSAGAIYCWGDNSHGQLGDGSTMGRPYPTLVSGITSGATAIAAGAQGTCAIVGDGVWCWGVLGAWGVYLLPTPIAGIEPGEARSVTVGRQHACVLTASGGVRCWGSAGQLGDGTTRASTVAVDVAGLESGVAAIDASNRFTCAQKVDGHIACWGDNLWKQLGVDTPPRALSPVLVEGLPQLCSGIAVGGQHACARTIVGTVACWGDSSMSQFPNGASWVATEISGFTGPVRGLTAGGAHTCALVGDGVACWGANWAGQLGSGDLTPRSEPGMVDGLP